MNEVWRPGVHFTAKKGWINDPNGMVYFQGKYHLFYQYNPFHCQWDSMHWGHAVSDDLLHWEELQTALTPDQEYDRDPDGGCFSGSALVKDGRLYLLYTGCVKRDGETVQSQCLAVSEDGVHFTKASQNPVIPAPPPGGGPDFRDPKVIWAQGRYRMLCGGTDGSADDKNSHGRIYLYCSEDLYRWEYQGILYEAKEGEGSMFECPDLFKAGDKWVLGASPMYRADGRQNVYMTGRLDFDDCRFQAEREGVLDEGPYYYAAQTYLDRENHPVSIAWLGGWPWMPWYKGLPPTDREGYRGVLSVPRRLRLEEGGHLCAEFAPKLREAGAECLYAETLTLSDRENPFRKRLHSADRPFYLRFTAELRAWTEKKLRMLLTGEAQPELSVTVDYEKELCTVLDSRKDADTRAGKREFALDTGSGRLSVELLVDGSVYTLFLQQGRHAYTGTFYPPHGRFGLQIQTPDKEASLREAELIFLK